MSSFNAYQRVLLDGMRGNIPRNPYGYEAGRQQHKKDTK